VLGIVMMQGFNHALDARLPDLHLSPAVQKSVDDQRSKLAGADVSASAPEVREAIDRSFVDAFRRVMLVGAGLALASAITAWALIAIQPAARHHLDR
jgi:hypothetical protein